MKKQLIICLLFSLLIVYGTRAQTANNHIVKTTATTQTKQESPVAPENVVVDLSPIGIKATLKAPPSVKAVAGEWSNSIVGNNNFEISVEETSMTFAAMKDKISADKANLITVTGDKSFIYKTSMMGRDMAHFECIVAIGGVSYRFYDKRVAPLSQEAIMPMYEAVKTITEK